MRTGSLAVPTHPGSPAREVGSGNGHLWSRLAAGGRGSGEDRELWVVSHQLYQNGLFCPASEGTPPGPYTGQMGFLGYYEIQQALHNET